MRSEYMYYLNQTNIYNYILLNLIFVSYLKNIT